MTKQLSLFDDDELVPIPECSAIALRIYRTPQRIAQLTIEAARIWQQRHPGKDVLDIITPDWRPYVRAHLKI